MMDRDDDLNALFAVASRQRHEPSAELTDRILADAIAVQPRPRPPVPAPPPRQNWFAALSGWLGGSGSLAGMTAAALTGLYLGVVQPTPVQALTAMLSGGTTLESLDLLPSGDMLLAQE
jgi:hypothetical protein